MISRLLQLARESAVYGLSSVSLRLVGIVLVPLYTRLFSPAEYGIIAMVASILGVVTLIVGLGAEASFAVHFHDSELPRERAALVSNYVLLQAVTAASMAVLLILFARPLAGVFLGSEPRAPFLRLAALTLFFNLFLAVDANLFRMLRRPWPLAWLNTGMTAFQIAASIVLVAGLRYGLFGHFLAQLATAVVFFAVSLWLLRPWLHAAPFSGEALRKIVRRGLPYVFTTSALFVVASSDRFFLARYRDLSVVGRYNLANQLAAVLGLATTAFQMALWPYVLSIRREPEARTTYANILTAFYAVGAGLAVALSLFAREIIGIVTTPAYQDAARVVPFLAFYVVGVGVSYIASIGLWMAKQTDHLAWTAAIGAAANLGLNLLLIPRFGMIGAGVATVLSQALYIAAMFWASERCYSIPYRWRHLASITALSAGWIALGTLAEREPGPASLVPKALLLLLFPLGLVAARVVAPRQLRSAAEGIGRLARARLSKGAA